MTAGTGSRLTLTAAAKLWGKSRQTLYNDQKAGKLSFGHDEQGTVYVEASELRRAYGEPPSRLDASQDSQQDKIGQGAGQDADEASKLALKDIEIRHLQDTVGLLREQIARLSSEVDSLRTELDRTHETHRMTLRVLEHQRPAVSPALASVPLVERLASLWPRKSG